MISSGTVSLSSPLPLEGNPLIATSRMEGFSREDNGSKTVVRLAGSFDALSSPAARAALDALVDDQRSPVAIDMSSLHSIDSSGVGAVVSLYKRVRAQGGHLTVQGLKGQPLAIFQLLRLDRLMAS
jgi:anti-sigma B factor antagonist